VAVLAVLCGAAFVLQLYHFWPFITDDAYISLRYSQRLLAGQGLTWNGLRPAVEGYTNLLWVLLCAALGALGMRLDVAAQALGIASTAAAMTAVAAQAYRDYPAKVRFVCALMGTMALALSAPVAVWSLGGLEQPLLAALLSWAAYYGVRWTAARKGLARDANRMGLLLALAVWTRADAALFAALFYLGAVLADGVRPSTVIARARMLVLPVAAFVAQEIFRRAYYGEWVPNTAYVKVAFTWHRLRTGLKYDLVGARAEIVFMALVLTGCAALWVAGKRRQVIFLLTPALGWLGYILVVGGDIFPSFRHFVPAMALLALLIPGCGLLTLGAPFRFSRLRLTVFLLLTALVLTSNLSAPRETWEQEGRSIGMFLRQGFAAKHPLLSSDAAGVVPFYAGMEAIDPLGLNDYHIARHPILDRGQGWVGHELGDGGYVLDHKPDLVLLSNYAGEPFFPADQQLLADPRFSALYQRIALDVPPPHAIRAIVYIRRVDGPLGVQVMGDRESVPAYLTTSTDTNAVRLIDGQVELVIAPHGRAEFAAVPLAAGGWGLSLAGAGTGQLAAQPAEVAAGADGRASFAVTNRSGSPAVLKSVELMRTR
jgi:arabinofuranosyltransferase